VTTTNTLLIKWREPETPVAARDEHGQLLVHWLTLEGVHQHGGATYFTNASTHCGVLIGPRLRGEYIPEHEPVTCERCKELAGAPEGRRAIEAVEDILREARRPQPVAA
jgi:hypothetical protein